MEINKMNDSSPTVAVVGVTDTLMDKVQAVLVILTGKNAVFTAFDITKQLRNGNAGMDIPHLDVKEMVFEEWKNTFCDEYESTLTELTIGQHAYVYHPETVSPLTHPLAVKPDTDTDDSDLTVESRLNISKPLLSPLNLSAGKLVNVAVDNGVMALTPTTDPAGKTLVVNADGRLRIGEKMLTSAFGQLHTKYDIALSSDTSTITPNSKLFFKESYDEREDSNL
jgi:hypothetical protein